MTIIRRPSCRHFVRHQSKETSMSDRVTYHRLQVAPVLANFIEQQALPGTGVSAEDFWKGFDALVHDLAPENVQLLAERDRIQAALDDWHRANPGPIKDAQAYQAFLKDIGYLVEAPASVQVKTS